MQRQDSRAGDDVAQCWKDLQAETGFKSYLDYVSAHEERNGQSPWNSAFKPGSPPRVCVCFMFELFKGADLAVNLRASRLDALGLGILQSLQHPPRDVCVQVFIWQVYGTEDISQQLVDAFGLGLGISPQFFKALNLLAKGKPAEEDIPTHKTELRPLRSDFIVMGNAAITISRYQDRGENSVPVVLIAGNLSPKTRTDSVLDCVDQELREAPTSKLPMGEVPDSREPDSQTMSIDRYMPCDRSSQLYDFLSGTVREFTGFDTWFFSYCELLGQLLRRDDIQRKSDNTLSFVAILPVLQLDGLWIRKSCRLLRLKLPNLGSDADVDITGVHADRRSLRRLVEDVEDSLDHLRMHVTWEGIKKCLKQPIYKNVEQQVKQCCRQARRLEAEARDSLQLEAGLLALQESRKSIELSNYQIQEGKRVKIFTVLAFVYVPLNLATSIFGMDLQQLNDSGQQIWVFIITAVAAILVTAGLWFCFEQVIDYKTWQQREQGGIFWGKYHPESKYFVATRLKMFVWLVINGHVSWMLKSGAWWRILVNDKTRLRENNVSNQHLLLTTGLYGMTACDYVLEIGILGRLRNERNFDPFDSEEVSWKKGSQWPPWPKFWIARYQRNT